jgi:lambda family phage portal protein
MRYMLREVAAGSDVSYESLSRDYSQSNYSSSRLALLDDRDCWRALQLWWIRSFREPLHRQWMQAAALSKAIPGITPAGYAMNIEKYEQVRFKPRGWSWVDPTKEVTAYREAVTAGFKTVSQVIAETAGGQDIEDVMTERADELEMMDGLGLVFETSPEMYAKEDPPPPPPDDDPPDEADDTDAQAQNPQKRVFSFVRNP